MRRAIYAKISVSEGVIAFFRRPWKDRDKAGVGLGRSPGSSEQGVGI